jgi:hypothetical protein
MADAMDVDTPTGATDTTVIKKGGKADQRFTVKKVRSLIRFFCRKRKTDAGEKTNIDDHLTVVISQSSKPLHYGRGVSPSPLFHSHGTCH